MRWSGGASRSGRSPGSPSPSSSRHRPAAPAARRGSRAPAGAACAAAQPRPRGGIVATGLLVAGHYGAYTFVSPALLDISGVSSGLIGALLLGYGVLGMVGNGSPAPGRPVARPHVAAIVSCSVPTARVPPARRDAVGGHHPVDGVGLRLRRSAGDPADVGADRGAESAEAATAVYCFVFNMAIAPGALAGSVVVDALGVRASWVGAALVLLVLVTVRRAPVAAAAH